MQNSAKLLLRDRMFTALKLRGIYAEDRNASVYVHCTVECLLDLSIIPRNKYEQNTNCPSIFLQTITSPHRTNQIKNNEAAYKIYHDPTR